VLVRMRGRTATSLRPAERDLAESTPLELGITAPIEASASPRAPQARARTTASSQGVSLRPPLKWAGGKRWLVHHLAPLWSPQSGRRLVEPFAGGLAVSLGLAPVRALLSDVNPHPINLYQWIQRGLTLSIDLRNESQTFYRHRQRFNDLVASGRADSKEAAELFYYLNRTCYNGLCRFNRSGGFNVPFGRYRTINYAHDFMAYRPLLRKWNFQVADFENLRVRKEDFLYADPPYDVPFTHYSKEGFSWDDQVRLAKWLREHDGPVVTSNQATERILELYRGLGFHVTVLPAPRMINCTGDRTPAIEMLATRGF
jgi:DNA adenine methylase